MTIEALLNQSCDIYRKTVTKNAYKQTVTTWSLVKAGVSCRIDYMFVTSSFLSQTPNGQISGNDYVGYFEKGTDIQKGDRILWQDLYLFARPVNYAFGNKQLHHLEVMFGLQET